MHKLFFAISLAFLALNTHAQIFNINATKQIALDDAFKASRMLDVPEKFVGQEYDLKYHRFNWNVDPDTCYISGSVTSYFIPVQNNLTQIDFSLKVNMMVDSVKYHGAPAMSVHVNNEVNITGFPPLSAGILDSITVYYHGTPQATSGFISFVASTHGSGTPALWTLSEPYGAYEWWPCKNDLSDKIDSIDIYVTHPNGYHAASNGILVSETVGATTTAHWKHRYPIAAYLIAIAVSDYSIFSDDFSLSTGTIPMLSYVYPESLTDAQNMTPLLEDVMQFYDSLIAPYPYMTEKYGHAQFGWGGGMEHQTMSFMGGFGYELMAHELLHQWFGDAVTCGSWHDIWLNEGFATYFTALNYERTSPDYYWIIWKNNTVNHVTSDPGGSVFVYDTSDVSRVFDSRLSYNKAAYMLHMLRWVVGDDNFFQGNRNYFNDANFYFGYAKSPDYIAHMEAQSGMDLTGFFDDWLYHEGYPSYTIVAMPIPGDSLSIAIDQTQSHSSVSFFEMPVPIQIDDSIYVFDNTFSGQEFRIPYTSFPTTMQFDPEFQLLSGFNQVILLSTQEHDVPEISLYPNPAENQLFISGAENQPINCHIYDSRGALVISDEISANESVDIQRLATGAYRISVSTADWQYSSSFIKK
ncbi:MAG TPA: M1 family aminopeptidase [Bacteroidales bacterium]|nr:M1 family aminopeptidase [Bacteroidales bacterium]